MGVTVHVAEFKQQGADGGGVSFLTEDVLSSFQVGATPL